MTAHIIYFQDTTITSNMKQLLPKQFLLKSNKTYLCPLNDFIKTNTFSTPQILGTFAVVVVVVVGISDYDMQK